MGPGRAAGRREAGVKAGESGFLLLWLGGPEVGGRIGRGHVHGCLRLSRDSVRYKTSRHACESAAELTKTPKCKKSKCIACERSAGAGRSKVDAGGYKPDLVPFQNRQVSSQRFKVSVPVASGEQNGRERGWLCLQPPSAPAHALSCYSGGLWRQLAVPTCPVSLSSGSRIARELCLSPRPDLS